jgi:hypothetical protein
VRFQVLTAASMMFRIVFWDVLPCKRRSTIILHGSTSQKTILNNTTPLQPNFGSLFAFQNLFLKKNSAGYTVQFDKHDVSAPDSVPVFR